MLEGQIASAVKPAAELEELLRIPAAARVLGIKEKTLRKWVWRRKITFVKVGRGIGFRPSDLREFINKNVVLSR